MRRQLHWLFVIGAVAVLCFESLAWAGAAALPDIGPAIRRSVSHEAPFASGYAVIGDALRPIPPLRDYGDSFAAQAFEPLRARIAAAPELATELAFGPTTSPAHGRLKLFYYAPLILLGLAGLAFATRPPKVHMIPRRR